MRRILAGVSRVQLATALGVTFQQVEKYEKGANRISASRLQQIGSVLGVSASFFFDGAPAANTSDVSRMGSVTFSDISSFLSTREGARLAKSFSRISSVRTRRRIVDLVAALGELESE